MAATGFFVETNGVHAGLSDSQADEVETSLMAMPTIHMAAHCVVDGEESSDIMESDIVTCTAHVMLTRHSHLSPGMLQYMFILPVQRKASLWIFPCFMRLICTVQ